MTALEILKRLEWRDGRNFDFYGDRECPICLKEHHQMSTIKSHEAGCELKAEIDRLEAEQKLHDLDAKDTESVA